MECGSYMTQTASLKPVAREIGDHLGDSSCCLEFL